LSLEALLALLAKVLADAGVPYMLTGSLAGAYHGAPRATQDIDLVVDATAEALTGVATALRAAGLYVSDDAIREAVATRGMFNAIDPASGWKVDFIVRKERGFSAKEFDRRREIEFMGLSLTVAEAEDVVIAKLEWAKLGDSERQLRDVAEIVAVQGAQLDIIQIERWVEELGLWKQWQGVLEMNDRGGESV
jgi:hypothetical protein